MGSKKRHNRCSDLGFQLRQRKKSLLERISYFIKINEATSDTIFCLLKFYYIFLHKSSCETILLLIHDSSYTCIFQTVYLYLIGSFMVF